VKRRREEEGDKGEEGMKAWMKRDQRSQQVAGEREIFCPPLPSNLSFGSIRKQDEERMKEGSI